MGTPDLEARLRALPKVAHPHTAADVLAQAAGRRRRRLRLAGTGVALLAAATLAVTVLPLSSDTRFRGGSLRPGVAFQAVAEGPDGPRPLSSGGRLAANEAVVFRVLTDGPGLLTLTEADGRPIWPAGGSTWQVEAGEHFVGEAGPLAWTPDAGPHGIHQVVATLCPLSEGASHDCATASFTVQWER